jgi:tetratricopeptide (TPR) repeat protein
METETMMSRLAVAFLAAAFLAGPSFAQVSPESAEKYQAGQEQFQKRRYADAIELFEEAVSLDGKNAQAYQGMGLTYQKMRDYPKAADAFKMAISVDAEYTAAYFALGQLQLISLKKYDDAQGSLKKVLGLDPNYEKGKARKMLANAHLKLGATHHRQKNYKAAAAQYVSASQVDPSSERTFYNLGLAYKSAREYTKAINALSTATDLNPEYDKAYRVLGDIYKATRKNSKAISSYGKAIKANPKEVRGYRSLAQVYSSNKQYAKAASTLAKAIAIKPGDGQLHTDLGFAYHSQKQFSKAIASYKKAIANGGKSEAHYRLSVSYFEAQKFSAAISSAKKALGSKHDVPANVILGDTYEAMKGDGWKNKAIKHYKRGLKDRRYKKYCEDKIDRINNPMGSEEEVGD